MLDSLDLYLLDGVCEEVANLRSAIHRISLVTRVVVVLLDLGVDPLDILVQGGDGRIDVSAVEGVKVRLL